MSEPAVKPAWGIVGDSGERGDAHPVWEAHRQRSTRQALPLIDQAAESHEPLFISGKRGGAVLVAEEDWKAFQETLYLLSVPGKGKSIKEGMAEPLDEGAPELDW